MSMVILETLPEMVIVTAVMTSNPYILHQLRLLNGWHGNQENVREELNSPSLFIALCYAIGNFKTTFKVASQLWENFRYHKSVYIHRENCKLNCV